MSTPKESKFLNGGGLEYLWEKIVSKFQTKAIADSGSYYTTDTVEGALQEVGSDIISLESGKQDTLIAGSNITISNNVISAEGGGGYVAQDEPPEDTDVLWVDTSDDSSNAIDYETEIINKPLINGIELVGNKSLSQLGISYNTNRNLLDNWYFGNPINQRGLTSYPEVTSGSYTIDRWVSMRGMIINSGYISSSSIHQKYEKLNELEGKTLTFSVLFNDGTLESGTAVLNTSTNVYFVSKPTETFYMRFSSYWNAFQIYTDNSTMMEFVAVKLEFGSVQTLVHQENGVWVLNEIPNYTEELLKCQRYLYVLNGSGSAYFPVAAGLVQSETQARIFINCPTQLRSNPSVDISKAPLIAIISNGTVYTVTSTSISGTRAGIIYMLVNVSGSMSATLPAFLRMASTEGDPQIIFSAEL